MLCGAELVDASACLCAACAQTVTPLGERVCVKCGRAIKDEARYCLTCQNHVRNFDRARACYVYDGGARQLVHRLKFGNQRWLARAMARQMARRAQSCGMSGDLIVAVPLSREHFKRRGYNQAELLARFAGQYLAIDYAKGALIKTRDTAEQAKLTAKEREKNIDRAYAVADRVAVSGKRILLVDDVLTTGATASEVARVLKKAGAVRVEVLTFCATTLSLDFETLPERAADV